MYSLLVRDPRSLLSKVAGDALTTPLSRGSFVLCVHACNELTPRLISRARAQGSGFACMPCCIRDGLVTESASAHRYYSS